MVDVLAFKLLVTPILIAGVTLAGRRFGPAVGGWLAGLPLTSGPVSLFIALEQGSDFASQTAVGMLVGMMAFVAFCIGMARVGHRRTWSLALVGGFACYLVVEAAVFQWRPPFLWAVAVCAAGVAVGVAAMPRNVAKPAPSQPPWWDIPLRMVVATTLVVLLTGLAPRLGPMAVGLLSPFPVFVSVLAGFTHRHSGALAAVHLLRGVMLGAFSFAVFFLVVGTMLPQWGIGPTYTVAAACACLTNAAAFMFVRRRPEPAPASAARPTPDDEG